MLIGIAASVLLAGQAQAGTFFRLEVGQPIAAGANSKVKNAVLVVRPRLCDDAASVRITGAAEGFVNGVRQSVPVRLVALPEPGVHAVGRQWPDGEWVLHLTATCPAAKATTSVLVPLTKSGFDRSKTRVLPKAATPAEVDAALADVVRGAS
jgi:hypothetical protein